MELFSFYREIGIAAHFSTITNQISELSISSHYVLLASLLIVYLRILLAPRELGQILGIFTITCLILRILIGYVYSYSAYLKCCYACLVFVIFLEYSVFFSGMPTYTFQVNRNAKMHMKTTRTGIR